MLKVGRVSNYFGIHLNDKEIFAKYKSKSMKEYSFFGTLSFHYTKPIKQMDYPFTIMLKLRDLDHWDKKKNKFVKVPNIKCWKFGQYSKWGKAPCN